MRSVLASAAAAAAPAAPPSKAKGRGAAAPAAAKPAPKRQKEDPMAHYKAVYGTGAARGRAGGGKAGARGSPSLAA